MPQINAAGLELIKEFEGCSLAAYPDPGTGGEPYTIGYGHTGVFGGEPITLGMTITQEQADELLQHDLSATEQGVNELCAHSINPNQFAALVSFAYNVGLGALASSTLMRMVNAGNYTEAEQQFKNWVWAGGQVLPGLVRRREAEAQLFSTPVAKEAA